MSEVKSGLAAEPSEPTTKDGVLTPENVVELLNRIPVFCVADAKGELVAQQDASIGQGVEDFVLWYPDADMARKALNESPIKDAALKCLPLGLVVAVFAGWAEMGSSSEFRIAATEVALAAYEVIKPGALESVKEEGGWSLPIFYDRRLMRKEGLALFMIPEHARMAWEERRATFEAGSAEAGEELALEAVDLLTCVMQMMGRKDAADDLDWSRVVVIGSKAALELAATLAPAAGSETAVPASASYANRQALARKQQLCAKLNGIPVFALVLPGGSLLACPDENGKPFLPWVVDGPKAVAMRDSAIAQGQKQVALVAQPLGDILAVLLGWKSQTSPAAMRITSYAEAYQLLMRSVHGTPLEKKWMSRDWLVPVFWCNELNIGKRRTVYLHHLDMITAHKKFRAERAAAAAADGSASGSATTTEEDPCKLACFELADLMTAAFSGVEEWQDVVFVGPTNAIELTSFLNNQSQEPPPPLHEEPGATPPPMNEMKDDEPLAQGETADKVALSPADAPKSFYNPNEKPPSQVPWATLAALAIGLVALGVGYYLSLEVAIEPAPESPLPTEPGAAEATAMPGAAE